ncbi:hypothetical protein Tco_0464834 [Tanacetum coccineum]
MVVTSCIAGVLTRREVLEVEEATSNACPMEQERIEKDIKEAKKQSNTTKKREKDKMTQSQDVKHQPKSQPDSPTQQERNRNKGQNKVQGASYDKCSRFTAGLIGKF